MNREEFRSNRRDNSAESDFVGESDRNEARDEATNGQLTPQERLLLEINAVVWNGFNALNQFSDGAYYNDLMDMRQHIDGINNIILARASARANPDLVRRGEIIGGHRGMEIKREPLGAGDVITKTATHALGVQGDLTDVDLYGINETAVHNEAFMLDVMSGSGYTPALIDIDDGMLIESDVGVTEPPTDGELWRRNLVKMLATIRARGLRHGDLKGQNIITRNNHPWAIDWQESHYLGDIPPQRAPLSDSYMLMQHIEGTPDTDGRADIPRVARRWRCVLESLGARGPGLPLLGKTFVDLGCFQGDFVALAAAEGMEATGVDAGGFRERENSIEIGKEVWKDFPFGDLQLRQADLINARNYQCDVAMLFSTWPYVVNDYGKIAAEQVLSDLIAHSGAVFFETQLHGDGPGPDFLKTDDDVARELMWLGGNKVKALATFPVTGRPGMRTVWRIDG